MWLTRRVHFPPTPLSLLEFVQGFFNPSVNVCLLRQGATEEAGVAVSNRWRGFSACGWKWWQDWSFRFLVCLFFLIMLRMFWFNRLCLYWTVHLLLVLDLEFEQVCYVAIHQSTCLSKSWNLNSWQIRCKFICCHCPRNKQYFTNAFVLDWSGSWTRNVKWFVYTEQLFRSSKAFYQSLSSGGVRMWGESLCVQIYTHGQIGSCISASVFLFACFMV